MQFITFGVKLLNVTWLRDISSTHEGTFGKQESIITWRLILDWQRSIIASEFFLQEMASRFVKADGTLIKELKHRSENKNTKRNTV